MFLVLTGFSHFHYEKKYVLGIIRKTGVISIKKVDTLNSAKLMLLYPFLFFSAVLATSERSNISASEPTYNSSFYTKQKRLLTIIFGAKNRPHGHTAVGRSTSPHLGRLKIPEDLPCE